MHLLSTVVSIACILNLVTAAKPPPRCGRDSCIKTVRSNNRHGGHPGCTAFFRMTLIPPATTVTTTRTTTVPPGKQQRLAHRCDRQWCLSPQTAAAKVKRTTTNVPSPTTITTSQTSVPTYASAVCSDTVQYSSACNCINIPHQTTTLATPTTTEESVATQTAFSLVGGDQTGDTSVGGYRLHRKSDNSFDFTDVNSNAAAFVFDYSDNSLRLATSPDLTLYVDPAGSPVIASASRPPLFTNGVPLACDTQISLGDQLVCRPRGTEMDGQTYQFQGIGKDSTVIFGSSIAYDSYQFINLFMGRVPE